MKLLQQHSIKAIGVSLGAAVLLISGATSATAGTNAHAYTTDDNPGGHAWFVHDIDQFRVADNDEDGLRASGYIRFNGATHRLDDANGASTGSSGGWVEKDFNIAEGTDVDVRVCLRNGQNGEARFCSGWVDGEA